MNTFLELGGVFSYWISSGKSKVEFHVVNKDSKLNKLHIGKSVHIECVDVNQKLVEKVVNE